MAKKLVDLDNAREKKQLEVMKKIIAQGHCPFCLDNLRKYHKQPILKETKYWILTPNQWPYKHTKVHLLAIYKEHAEKLSELNPQAGVELIKLMQWAEKHYQAPGGGWCMRFGNSNYSAASVAHLHVQFLVPDIDAPDYLDKPVRVKIGKTKNRLKKKKNIHG